MKKYERPSVVVMDERAEGVFAASGDCYTITGYGHQRPEGGRENHCFQMNASHNATHHGTAQQLIVTFSAPVGFVSATTGTLVSGDGTNTLTISYGYHANEIETHGLGDLYVSGPDDLTIVSAVLTCNKACEQHDGLNN